MDAYCARVGKEAGSIRFLFDGDRIAPDATPNELGMEDEDEIDAMVEVWNYFWKCIPFCCDIAIEDGIRSHKSKRMPFVWFDPCTKQMEWMCVWLKLLIKYIATWRRTLKNLWNAMQWSDIWNWINISFYLINCNWSIDPLIDYYNSFCVDCTCWRGVDFFFPNDCFKRTYKQSANTVNPFNLYRLILLSIKSYLITHILIAHLISLPYSVMGLCTFRMSRLEPDSSFFSFVLQVLQWKSIGIRVEQDSWRKCGSVGDSLGEGLN